MVVKKLKIIFFCLISAFTLLLIGCSKNDEIDEVNSNEVEIIEDDTTETSDINKENLGIEQEEYDEDINSSIDSKINEIPKKISGESYVPKFVAQKDGWIYYINIDENNELYKIREDGTGKAKLCSYSIAEVCAVDNSIYFNTIDEGRLYSMNIEKEKIERLSYGAVTNLNIADDWIYYSNLSEDGKIYKMKLDGTLKTKVNDVESNYMVINDNWIYFCNGKDNNSIYKIKIDGTNMEQLNTDKSKDIMVSNGYIYYLNMNKHDVYSYLYKMKLDGGQKTELKELSIASYTMAGDWIYFVDGEDMYNSIYKMKNDGTEVTRLYSSGCGNIYAADGFIYYEGQVYDYKELYCLDITGLEEKYIISYGNPNNFDIKDDWIFYINGLDGNKLYRVNINTLEKVKISDAGVSYSEIYKDDIIYITETKEKSMYSMNLETNKTEYLDSNVTDIVKIQDDWIYYTNESDKLLCRINIEDINEKHIIKSPFVKDIRGGGTEFYTQLQLEAIKVEGEWIYYLNREDNHRLYKMSLDGTKDTKLTDYYIDGFVIYEDQIYYTDEQIESIYKMNIDGKQKTKLSDAYFVQNILTKDNWVYYSPSDDSICRIKNNGSDKTVIENDKAYDIKIKGDSLYYIKYRVGSIPDDDYFEVIKSDLDGTNKTTLTSANGVIGNLKIQDGKIYYCKYLEGKKIIKMNMNGKIVQIID